MVAVCRIVKGDAAELYPAVIDRMAPQENIRIEFDLTADIDCSLVGVTITDSTWAIHPDDDDGAMSLDQQAISGLVTSTRASKGTDGAYYRLINTNTLSDGQTIERTGAIPVVATRAPFS